MPPGAGGEAAVGHQVAAQDIVAIVVHARAAGRDARRAQAADVERLVRLGISVVDRSVQLLEIRVAVVAVIVVELDAIALHLVVGHVAVRRVVARTAPTPLISAAELGQAIAGIGVVERLGGQLQRVLAAEPEHDLAQRVAIVVGQRVRLRAVRAEPAHLALVVGLVAVAAAQHQHALHALAAERGARRRAPAAVGRIVAALEREIGRLAVDRQQRLRVLGDEVDGAGQAVAAVQHRGRPAQHLDTLVEIGVEIVAAARRARAEGERLRQRHAVLEHQHAIALQTADIDALVAGASRRARDAARPIGLAAHLDARLVLQRVLDVACVVVVDVVAGDHRYRSGGAAQLGGPHPIRGHRDRLERLLAAQRRRGCATLCLTRRPSRLHRIGLGHRHGASLREHGRHDDPDETTFELHLLLPVLSGSRSAAPTHIPGDCHGRLYRKRESLLFALVS